jgi:hypothetical protein
VKQGDNESSPAGAEPERENEGWPVTECLGTEPLQYRQPASTSSNQTRKLRIMVEICG